MLGAEGRTLSIENVSIALNGNVTAARVEVRDPDALLPNLDHAGEILLGDTPFAAANYLIGVPNTLPTGRYARLSSGVTARTFLKTSSIAQTSRAGLARLAPGIVALADHEGFPAHAAAITIRGLGRPSGP